MLLTRDDDMVRIDALQPTPVRVQSRECIRESDGQYSDPIPTPMLEENQKIVVTFRARPSTSDKQEEWSRKVLVRS
jgi:hypothetical protein